MAPAVVQFHLGTGIGVLLSVSAGIAVNAQPQDCYPHLNDTVFYGWPWKAVRYTRIADSEPYVVLHLTGIAIDAAMVLVFAYVVYRLLECYYRKRSPP